MLLSGMVGTGKSDVIKTFVEFVEGISIFFDWNYHSDVIKVSAYTGASVCQIPNGRALHSIAYTTYTVYPPDINIAKYSYEKYVHFVPRTLFSFIALTLWII